MAMGSIRTSTQSVPIIPHKLAPELSRCILFNKEACMVGRLFTQMELFGTLMRAGVDHVVYEQSLKNLMERMNEHIKGRTEAFDNMQKAKI